MKTAGMSKCIGCFSCALVCAAVNSKSHSFNKSRIKIRSYGGVSGKFSETICHGCKEPAACAEACPTDAIVARKGGGVTVNKKLCTGCKRCIDACVVGAVGFCEETKLPLICHHCGMCAKYCPHECITQEEVPD